MALNFHDDETDRGQVGIGTLIVFIAMVLVAAIAAGVLINTAGFLQTQAEHTGTEATEQVADNLNVITEVGKIDTNAENTIDEVRIGVQPAAGSDDLNLEEVSIQFVATGGTFGNLVHAKQADVHGEGTVFNTVAIVAEDAEDNVMTNNADRYEIVIPLGEERPFLEDVRLNESGDSYEELLIEDVEDSDDDRPAKFDIVINASELEVNLGNETDRENIAEAFDGVEADDIRNVSIDAEEAEDIDAELFTNASGTDDLDESDNYRTSPGDLEGGADFEDVGSLERIVVFGDEVDETQLEGFEEDPAENDPPERDQHFDREYIENLDNSNLEVLTEGEEAELTFTTETGAQTIAILRVPPSLAGEEDGDTIDL